MARGLNGSTQSLERNDQTELRPSFPLTVALWFKGGAQGNFKYLLSKLLTDGDHSSFAFSTNGSGDLRFFIGWGAAGGEVTPTSTVAASSVFDSTWHHIAGTYDGANIRLYVDGVEAPGTSVAETRAVAYASRALYFGSFDGGQLFATGSIAEVAIYSAVLDTDEMRSLGKAIAPPLVRPASLVAYWPLLGRADPEVELRQGMNLIVTGATTADHCRVIQRPSTPIPTPAPAGGGTQNADTSPDVDITVGRPRTAWTVGGPRTAWDVDRPQAAWTIGRPL